MVSVTYWDSIDMHVFLYILTFGSALSKLTISQQNNDSPAISLLKISVDIVPLLLVLFVSCVFLLN